MSFSQLSLHPDIIKAIHYPNLTPVQAQSMPSIMDGKDSVVSAHTGSGKTAAFVLPALHRLSDRQPSKTTRILILTPTRELAAQITKAASLYGKFLRFNIVSLVGGMPYYQQIKDLARGADIIVATPGRLLDHIEQGRVKLAGIEMLVLDEADRMLDMGFIDDVNKIAKMTPENRQTLLFSATVDKKLSTIVRHLLKNPVRIDLSQEKLSSPQITQLLYRTTHLHHKSQLLKQLLHSENIYKAIIFSATKRHASDLALQLRSAGFSAAALHGDLKQTVRSRTVEQLRKGQIQFLVATDVAARGIDISDVTHVINYDFPRFCEDYVHRIGRTGRAGKTGIAISFVLPGDTRHIQKLERYLNLRFQIKSAPAIDAAIAAEFASKQAFAAEDDDAAGEGGTGRGGDKHHKRKFSHDSGRGGWGNKGDRSGSREARGDRDSNRDRPWKKRDPSTNDGSSRPFRRAYENKDGDNRRPFVRRSDDSRSDGDRPFRKRADDSRHDGDRPFSRKRADDTRYDGDRPFRKRADDTRHDGGDRPSFKKPRDTDGDKPFKRAYTSKDSDRPFKRTTRSDDKPFKRSSESRDHHPAKEKHFAKDGQEVRYASSEKRFKKKSHS